LLLNGRLTNLCTHDLIGHPGAEREPVGEAVAHRGVGDSAGHRKHFGEELHAPFIVVEVVPGRRPIEQVL
jgi:hypothetical protein